MNLYQPFEPPPRRACQSCGTFTDLIEDMATGRLVCFKCDEKGKYDIDENN